MEEFPLTVTAAYALPLMAALGVGFVLSLRQKRRVYASGKDDSAPSLPEPPPLDAPPRWTPSAGRPPLDAPPALFGPGGATETLAALSLMALVELLNAPIPLLHGLGVGLLLARLGLLLALWRNVRHLKIVGIILNWTIALIAGFLTIALIGLQ